MSLFAMLDDLVEEFGAILEKGTDVFPNDRMEKVVAEGVGEVWVMRGVGIVFNEVFSDGQIMETKELVPKHVGDWGDACEEFEEDNASLGVGTGCGRRVRVGNRGRCGPVGSGLPG